MTVIRLAHVVKAKKYVTNREGVKDVVEYDDVIALIDYHYDPATLKTKGVRDGYSTHPISKQKLIVKKTFNTEKDLLAHLKTKGWVPR